MENQSSRHRELWNAVLLLAVLIVATAWTFCFVKAYLAAPTADSEIGSLGQFGDSFGAVNALFTGLALLGVAYAAIQQNEQIWQSREATIHERRVQFLAARLNGAVALLEALRISSSKQQPKLLEKYAARRQERLQLQLGFLLCEARLGFESDWSTHLEERAIRDYLIEILSDLKQASVGIWAMAQRAGELGFIFEDVQTHIFHVYAHVVDRNPDFAGRLRNYNTALVTHHGKNSSVVDVKAAIDRIIEELRQPIDSAASKRSPVAGSGQHLDDSAPPDP